jgi:hypothetical protein
VECALGRSHRGDGGVPGGGDQELTAAGAALLAGAPLVRPGW